MSALHGHLDLLACADAAGRTTLRRQVFRTPFHISKPHTDAGWLVVNLASPTPGLFAGDRFLVRGEVGAGARLLFAAPSASRLHTHPAAGSRYQQRSEVEVEKGGTLLWTETVAPGRTARGELIA